jgi:hypothetical protein
MTDIYLHLLNDKNSSDLPFLAKDNFARQLFSKFINKIKGLDGEYVEEINDYTTHRLDDLHNDVTKTASGELNNEMLNQRIQYITVNITATILLLHKYQMTNAIPLVFLFIVYFF